MIISPEQTHAVLKIFAASQENDERIHIYFHVDETDDTKDRTGDIATSLAQGFTYAYRIAPSQFPVVIDMLAKTPLESLIETADEDLITKHTALMNQLGHKAISGYEWTGSGRAEDVLDTQAAVQLIMDLSGLPGSEEHYVPNLRTIATIIE